MRYKVWRSRDNRLHVLSVEGRWDAIPSSVTSWGPWQGSTDGDVAALKTHYRALLLEQGWVAFHRPPTAMWLERYRRRLPYTGTLV